LPPCPHQQYNMIANQTKFIFYNSVQPITFTKRYDFTLASSSVLVQLWNTVTCKQSNSSRLAAENKNLARRRLILHLSEVGF